MTKPPVTIPVGELEGLRRARQAIIELEAKCCEPGRSPRLAVVASTLDDFEARIQGSIDAANADEALSLLEDAGSKVGALQVLCCAPGRMPLYADFLEGLMETQRALNRSLGRGH